MTDVELHLRGPFDQSGDRCDLCGSTMYAEASYSVIPSDPWPQVVICGDCTTIGSRERYRSLTDYRANLEAKLAILDWLEERRHVLNVYLDQREQRRQGSQPEDKQP